MNGALICVATMAAFIVVCSVAWIWKNRKGGIVYRCECCGKVFKAGRDAIGIPNGIAIPNDFGYETVICCDCVAYRSDRASKIVEQNKFKRPEDVTNG